VAICSSLEPGKSRAAKVGELFVYDSFSRLAMEEVSAVGRAVPTRCPARSLLPGLLLLPPLPLCSCSPHEQPLYDTASLHLLICLPADALVSGAPPEEA
jgi:hypothetical protein